MSPAYGAAGPSPVGNTKGSSSVLPQNVQYERPIDEKPKETKAESIRRLQAEMGSDGNSLHPETDRDTTEYERYAAFHKGWRRQIRSRPRRSDWGLTLRCA